MKNDTDLSRLLGRREAFSIVAARCSAADAGILRKIREEKLYLECAPDWDQFCTKDLHMSKDSANRLIRNLEEFGPMYFQVAQLTRISPQTYRAIAPSIRDEALHHNGEAIALIPENAEKVAAAVADLRKTAAAPKPETVPADPIPPLEADCSEILRKLEELIEARRQPTQLKAVIGWMRSRLDRLELTV